MTQQISIQIPSQNLTVSPAALLALLSGEQPAPAGLPAEIGAELQGGIYVGPYVENGQIVHLIAAPESLGDEEWDDAQTAASEYRGGGYDDWRLPTNPEALIALAHAQDKFEKVYHWTGTPCDSYCAWAVGFEGGNVLITNRDSEFRVRPVRRFTA